MTRLCTDLHESLTVGVIQSLFDKSIFTCLAFVRTNPELLVKVTGLQYNQILHVKDKIFTKFSSILKCGNKHFQELISQCAILPTCIRDFDSLIDGGLVSGNIYELCGSGGCGKTQICMTIAANICLKNEHQIFYIYTKNDLSAHRISDIIEHKNILNVGEVMQKIQIFHAFSAYNALQKLHMLENLLRESEKNYLGFRLIIIDSLSNLFQNFHDLNEGLVVLNNVATLLKFICIKHHMVVLLTNYISTWASGVTNEWENESNDHTNIYLKEQQTGLGKYWDYVPNCRICVKKSQTSGETLLTIMKSFNQPVGKSVKIKISKAGAV